MSNLKGGYITSSRVAGIIHYLSNKYNQTAQKKLEINNSITNTGHGSVFLGSSSHLEGGDRNIRMLVGAHFSGYGKLKVGIFGGSCDAGERTLFTVIRETIEEVFGIRPHSILLDLISEFLNMNPDYYYINASTDGRSFTYIFDVSILGDFIRIFESQRGACRIPTIYGYKECFSYLVLGEAFEDASSFQGKIRGASDEYTIDLIKFIRERYIPNKINSLTEIKYLSFVSLYKLIGSIPFGYYDVFNFTNNKRERLEHQTFFNRHLQKDIYKEILSL